MISVSDNVWGLTSTGVWNEVEGWVRFLMYDMEREVESAFQGILWLREAL